MKVTTKVALGAGLLVAVLLLALARDVALVRGLATAHRTLSEERFSAVTTTLEMLRTLELVEQGQAKLLVTRDADYRVRIDRHAATFEGLLAGQRALSLPETESHAVEAVAKSWELWRTTAAARFDVLARATAPERDALRAELVERIRAVRAEAATLFTVVRAGIERDVARSERIADEGERDSRRLAALAVLLAVLFVLVTFWSLNGPLSRLLAATRHVGSGRYAKLAPRGSDELSVLARAFDSMVERLDEVDRAKRDFVSLVSHELKTPLAAMQETTNLLAEGLAGPLTDKQRRMLALNLDAGRRLSAMLSRLLDVARLDAGAVTYDVSEVDVRALLAEAHQAFDARLAEGRLTAMVSLPDEPVVVHADRDWLLQVFENLLENAVKFSEPERRIWLALRIVSHPEEAGRPARALVGRGACALVTVSDEGPGIPEEARERVFTRFYQVEKRRRSGAGVGLGLSIVRDIVAAHGGVVWVDGRVEGGSVLSVALPLPVEGMDETGDPVEKSARAVADPPPVDAPRRVRV